MPDNPLDQRRLRGSQSPCITAREELEESWRRKLEEAGKRHRAASARYGRLKAMATGDLPVGHKEELEQARQEAVQALATFTQTLKTFTQLTVHHRVPREQAATGGDGGL